MEVNSDQDLLLAIETTGEIKEIWNPSQFDESSSLCFNESITIEFIGELDINALERSLGQLLERHASLRACFSIDGKYMMIKNHQQLDFKHKTFQNTSEIQAELIKEEREQCLTLFDLSNGPLIRFVLLTPKENTPSTKSYLVLTAHHIVCDGWSWAILTSDLGHFYNGEVNKVFSPLPQAAQYWNYAQYKENGDKREDRKFWQEVFALPPKIIDYNKVKERPAFRSFNSQRIDTPCSSETIIKLRQEARTHKVTLYQYLLGAFFMTLAQKSKSSDITIGISQAGQTIPKFSSLVGHCVGLLPIRVEDFEADHFDSDLGKVKRAMLAAQKHSQLSFGEVCEVSVTERDPARVPLVPITFNLDIQPAGQGLDFTDLKCRFSTNPRFYENFEMFINLTLIGDNAVIENHFNTDLYTHEEIIHLQETYRNFLDHLASGLPAESFHFDFENYKYKQLEEKEDKKHKKHKVEIKETSSNAQTPVVPEELVSELKAIWQEILGVSDITAVDGFFSLGGHSLLVTEVILTVKERLGITLSMKDLFLNQEFDAFCGVVYEKSALSGNMNNSSSKTGDAQYEDEASLLKIGKGSFDPDAAPLSWQQQRTWLFQELNPDSSLFNLSSLFQFIGDLDVDALKKALIHFQCTHPLIHSNLFTKVGMPYWHVDENLSTLQNVEVVDLNTQYPNVSLEEIIKDLVQNYSDEAKRAFDMKGPLYHAKIFYFNNPLPNQPDYIFLAQKVHHIIWDGWCYDIFLDELERNYKAIIAKQELPAPLELTYFDYARWQSELPQKGLYQEKLNYWKEIFSELPEPLDLPIRPGLKRTEKKFVGTSHFIKWSEESVLALEELGRKHGTTLFNVLMTTFKLFLSRYSGQEDIVVGTPVRGRDAEDLDKVIGFFVNNIAIRSQVSTHLSFSENLKHVSRNTALGFENGLIPFDVIVKEVMTQRDNARTPLYQAFFMYQDATNREAKFCSAERSSFRLPRGACHTDIDFWARRDGEGMIGGFDFDDELFSESQMIQMAEDFKTFLGEVATLSKNDQKVSSARFLNPKHFNYLTQELNQTASSFDDNSSIAELIDITAAKNPEKVAIVAARGKLTYGELSHYSDQLAQYLIDHGVKKGDLVGMALPRHHYLPVCLLAIIKAGAGYVPLDPTYPADRLAYMIENSHLQLTLCDPKDKNLEIFNKIETIEITDPGADDSKNDPVWGNTIKDKDTLAERAADFSCEDTCYVIYTSGSTGLPKGVDISHRSMVNFLESMVKAPGVTEQDTLIAVTTMSFDIAVLEIYSPLLAGAKLYICSKEESMFGDALMEVITGQQGTILQATPATWRQLVVNGLKDHKLRCASQGLTFKALCGGEPLPSDLKEQILASVHELWNMYGPTETTVWSTCHQVLNEDSWVSIGRPIANTQIYILSEELELCPYGSIGEICIAGAGIARGYLNRADLTSERFVPCLALDGKIVYRTGDLGRYREEGLLECLGRNDGQVKVRGFRIELGEIESIISQTSGINSQVVMVREDRPGDARIVAYFIKDAILETTAAAELISAIKKNLKDNLPFYMMPSHFIELKEFPLTLNGKIDRKQLPAPHMDTSTPQIEKQKVLPQINTDTSLRDKFKAIWAECLNISDVDSVEDEDDFFQVGGHSLLSVTLFSKIETSLGLSLPLSTLFEKTTFGELLIVLEGNGVKGSKDIAGEHLLEIESDYLVALRRGEGNRHALFFFHGVGGNILNYKRLMSFIPEKFDVYGLQSPGVLGEADLAASISEMAIYYANDISKLQGYEKVIFSGGSMGGLLSFETARELKDLGGEVSEIIMFDTFGPKEAFAGLAAAKPEKLFSRLGTSLSFRIRKFNARFHYWLASINKKPVPHKYRHFMVELNNYRLLNHHSIVPFDTHIDLLRAPVAKEGKYSLPDLGWDQAALKGCTSHIVANVDHDNFVESPVVAKTFRKLLEEF